MQKHQNLFYLRYVLDDNDNAQVHLTAFPQKASPVPAETESPQEVVGLRQLFWVNWNCISGNTSLFIHQRHPRTTAQLP